jgi:thiamine biosynthesis protein ThiS
VKVSVNGKERELSDDGVTVQSLLAELKYSVPLFVVTVNGSLVKREDYAAAPIAAGDSVEVYNLVAGG